MDEPYFRQRYDADKQNQARQTWKQYQEWVGTFYEGKRFPPVAGWNDREKEILGKLAPEARPEVQPQLESVGRLLASEWAKDNSVRKVSTGDLQSWGKGFSDAARDPKALLDNLRQVETDLKRRLGES